MGTQKDAAVRVQLDLTSERVAELEELMAKTGVSTRKDVFENALALFDWAVTQSEQGRTFGAWDEGSKTFHEVLMPSLAHVSRKAVKPPPVQSKRPS